MFTYGGASKKTMVDSDGVLKWAPHNLCRQSTNLNTSPWSNLGTITRTEGTGETTDPDGGSLACKLVQSTNEARVLQGSLVTGANTYRFYQLTGAGTKGSYLAGGWSSDSISSVGDGWYLITCVKGNRTIRLYAKAAEWDCILIQVNGGSLYIGPNNSTTATSTADGSSGIYVAFVSVVDNTFDMVDNPDRGDSYVPTTTSAVYLPRRNSYRYNGSSYVNKGITLESEAATNKIASSNDSSGWTTNASGSLTLTADQETGPDGNLSLTKVKVTDTANEFHSVEVAGSQTSSIGRYYLFSGYVKDDPTNSQQYILARCYFNVGNWVSVIYDMINGTVTKTQDVVATHIDSGMVEVADGLWRFYVVALSSGAQGSSNTNKFTLSTVSSGTATIDSFGREEYAGAGTETFYCGHFDLIESTTVPVLSSHIPTSGTTQTRAAETLTIAGADMAYDATNMSFHIDGEWNHADTDSAGNFVAINWYENVNNKTSIFIDSDRGAGGINYFLMNASVSTREESGGSDLSAGVNIPLNMAMRIVDNGATTTINGALNGSAYTAATSSLPSSFPDLSASSFYFGSGDASMERGAIGTVSLFRQWDVDLGDTGIEEATLAGTGYTPAASGGTESVFDTGGGTYYRIHTFTSDGTLTVNSAVDVEYLIVAGGGGAGGGSYSGGGGAGQVLKYVSGEGNNTAVSALSLTAGSESVVVGDGGIVIGDGADSTFGGLTADGGGPGGYGGTGNQALANGDDGGSGGGGGGALSGSTGGSAVSGDLGNNGGTGFSSGSAVAPGRASGGGGGATAAGTNAASSDPGEGGAGVATSH
jgi:hypothetical protein